jgi:hypothetical protein
MIRPVRLEIAAAIGGFDSRTEAPLATTSSLF